MKKIDKVIQAFRKKLNEEGPTMNVGSNYGETSLGFNTKTETPPVKNSKKKYIYQKGLRKWWSKET